MADLLARVEPLLADIDCPGRYRRPEGPNRCVPAPYSKDL